MRDYPTYKNSYNAPTFYYVDPNIIFNRGLVQAEAADETGPLYMYGEQVADAMEFETSEDAHDDQADATGYHELDIPQGEYGELSKVAEEFFEALDAEEQENPVMVLLELSDMVGAIDGYLERYHPSITLDDLIVMADATHDAFASGRRVSKS